MKTRIKDLREDADITQSEISRYLNISQVAYSYYELGKRNIPLELLCMRNIPLFFCLTLISQQKKRLHRWYP